MWASMCAWPRSRPRWRSTSSTSWPGGGDDDDAQQNVGLLLTVAARSAATLDAKLATARRLIEELAQAVDAVTQKLQMLDALRGRRR